MLITSADVKARFTLLSSWILSGDSERCHVRHPRSFFGYFLSWKSTDSCVSLCVEDGGKFWVNYQWTQFRHFRQLVDKPSHGRVLNVLGVCWWRVNFISKASRQSGGFRHLFRHLSLCVSLCKMMHVNTRRAFFPDHCWMWELLRAHWKSHLKRQSWSSMSKNCIFFFLFEYEENC